MKKGNIKPAFIFKGGMGPGVAPKGKGTKKKPTPKSRAKVKPYPKRIPGMKDKYSDLMVVEADPGILEGET